MLKNAECTKRIYLGEAQTLVYAYRVIENGHVNVCCCQVFLQQILIIFSQKNGGIRVIDDDGKIIDTMARYRKILSVMM